MGDEPRKRVGRPRVYRDPQADLNLSIDYSLKELLREVADKRGQSLRAAIEEAIGLYLREYLQDEKSNPR